MDVAIVVDDSKETSGYLFVPVKKIENDTIVGLVAESYEGPAIDNKDKIAPEDDCEYQVYCAVPKINDMCDAYILSHDWKDKLTISEIVELKPNTQYKVRLRGEFSPEMRYLSFHQKKNVSKLKEEIESNIAPKKLKSLLIFAEEIAKEYKAGGRKGVKAKYGKSEMEETAEFAKNQEAKKIAAARARQIVEDEEESSPLSKKIRLCPTK